VLIVELETLQDLLVQVGEMLGMPDHDVAVNAVILFKINPES
jgi:hypothetical protein